MEIEKIDIIQRWLKEMQLNYKKQYPQEIPNMDLIANIILNDIK